MKTTILWDNDGVLVDTEPLYFEATQQQLRRLGIELHQDDYIGDMAMGISAWERAARAGYSAEALTPYRTARNQHYQALLKERSIDIEGAEETVADLATRYQMAIVTSSKPEDFDLIHEARNLRRHMAFVLAKGDYPRSKPHPDPYLTALERFGASAAESVVIEDSERGLRAAVAAGIDCVVVRNHFVVGQDLSAATHQVESLGELLALLETM